MGNLNAKSDLGHAKDYTEMQWRILQQKKPDDFVVATGHAFSVRQFVEIASNYLNLKCKHQNFYLSRFHVALHHFLRLIGHNYRIVKFDNEELSLKFFPFHIIILTSFVSRKSP